MPLTRTRGMAEGACLAMEDAVVLGEELSRASDVPTALRAFHARRQPRVREVVRIALEASRRMAASTSLYASPIGRRIAASESMYKFLASYRPRASGGTRSLR